MLLLQNMHWKKCSDSVEVNILLKVLLEKKVRDVKIIINFLDAERDWNIGQDYDLLVQAV